MKIKKIFLLIFCLTILSFVLPTTSVFADDNRIYLGGMPVGITVKTRGAEVVGLTDVLTNDGLKSPAKDGGVEIGDYILSIGETEINSAADIEKSISDGKLTAIVLERGRDKKIISITPALDTSGKYRLGLFVKDGISGIGTITFFKNGRFASLGHPILSESGVMTEIIGGEIYKCSINGFLRGERGKAGELRGTFLSKNPIGAVDKNSICGVFGNINKDYYKNYQAIEEGDGVMGKATILSTVDGDTPTEYSISIVKADSPYKPEKHYVIKITDERLLNSTGGIVQGMSGSPILQNGKIVGAVTHVFINDPTRGFGISIKTMLNNM